MSTIRVSRMHSGYRLEKEEDVTLEVIAVSQVFGGRVELSQEIARGYFMVVWWAYAMEEGEVKGEFPTLESAVPVYLAEVLERGMAEREGVRLRGL